MNTIHLSRHEWREVLRDNTGAWAPIAFLLLSARYLRHRERHGG